MPDIKILRIELTQISENLPSPSLPKRVIPPLGDSMNHTVIARLFINDEDIRALLSIQGAVHTRHVLRVRYF